MKENENKPQEGKQYRLTGGPDTPSIANGNTWEESECSEFALDSIPPIEYNTPMKKTIWSTFLSPLNGIITLSEIQGEGYRYYTILSADGKVCKTSISRSHIHREFKGLKNIHLSNRKAW